MRKILANSVKLFKLAYLTPFFIGPVITAIPPVRIFLEGYLKRYACFLLLASSWIAVSAYLLQFYVKNSNKVCTYSSNKQRLLEFIKYSALVILVLLFMGSLELFRRNLTQDVSYLALFSIGTSAIALALKQKNYLLAALPFQVAWITCVSFISIMITAQEWHWEPAVFCVALGCVLNAPYVAQIIFKRQENVLSDNAKTETASKDLLALTRLHSIFLIAGPAIIASLCIAGSLERDYLLVFICAPLISKLAIQSREIASGKAVAKSYHWLSECVAFLYCAVFVLIRSL